MKNISNITPSLTQGEKFNKYQNKIGKSHSNLNLVEGFDNNNNPFFQTSNQQKLSKTQLVEQTNDVLTETNNILNNSSGSLTQLKEQYQDTLTKYNNLLNEINGESSSFVTRVSSSNPYLNKVVRFTTGHICYVTNQGVVKYIPTIEIWDGLIKNGCANDYNYIQLDVPWLDNYSNSGVSIPTNPPLITGTFMKLNQGCGYEGQNVFVSNLVSDSQASSSYLGCYNNNSPPTEIKINPIMDSTNAANGFTCNATSVYFGDNNSYGPWRAFDGNPDTCWHSTISDGSRLYNSSTGVYEGVSGWNFIGTDGTTQNAKGEFIQISLPSAMSLSRYEIQPRLDYPQRAPNSWHIFARTNNNWYEIDYRTNESVNDYHSNEYVNNGINSFSISSNFSNIPYDSFILMITVVGNPDKYFDLADHSCIQIAEWDLYTTINGNSNSSGPAMTNISSSSTFDECQSYAINNGYKYFGLQNAQSDGTGQCMVSNESAQAEIFGEAFKYAETTLWSSDTSSGTNALLNNSGSLQVLNSSNSAVYSSPATNTTPANYIGCYNDTNEQRALPDVIDWLTDDYGTCQSQATSAGYDYYGIQWYHPVSDTVSQSQCFAGNDESLAKKFGIASNCQTLSNGTVVGGALSNAVYSTSPGTATYYLLLQDDGNMTLSRGTGPTDNQGRIWALDAISLGKQQDPNPMFAAFNGKYKRNYIVSGETLSMNEFIGSTNGTTYLVMQSDGNLVLKTSKKTTACSANSNNKTVGGQTSNAIYQISQAGNKSNMGQIGFIDGDSVLYPYETTNIKYINDYTKIEGMDTPNNNIKSFNGNLEQCKSSCNENNDCGGFVYDEQNSVCWIKNNGMYPAGSISISPSNSIYIRNKSPIQPPVGASKNISNIDSIQYQTYLKGDVLPTSTGLANANSYQKQQLSQLEDQLNLLSSQMTDYTNKFSQINTKINKQSSENTSGLGNYLDEMGETTTDIQKGNKSLINIGNIEKQVNIQTLQQNYKYMFWTILAGVLILVIINMKKHIT
jgi:hypothetical protein